MQGYVSEEYRTPPTRERPGDERDSHMQEITETPAYRTFVPQLAHIDPAAQVRWSQTSQPVEFQAQYYIQVLCDSIIGVIY